MADSTYRTRASQWEHYLNFCADYDQEPLPGSLDTILLYITFMSMSFKYVSIINYLSAVWVFHKLNHYDHVNPSCFKLKMTLKGIKRSIGDEQIQARPITVPELSRIYSLLDFTDT